MYMSLGRGSGSPCLDVFITLLSLGQKGYKQLCTQRKVWYVYHSKYGAFMHSHVIMQDNYVYLKEKLSEVCGRHGVRVLDTRHNPISLG